MDTLGRGLENPRYSRIHVATRNMSPAEKLVQQVALIGVHNVNCARHDVIAMESLRLLSVVVRKCGTKFECVQRPAQKAYSSA